MEHKTVWDFISPDMTAVYEWFNGGFIRLSGYELCKLKPDTYFYLPPWLSYGDYDNSTDIERSNARVFMETFKDVEGWFVKNYSNTEQTIAIDLTCNNPEILATLEGLANYPVINDEDLSNMASEMEQDAWNSYLKADFTDAILKRFKADYCDAEDDAAFELYRQLKDKANLQAQIISGGNVYIDESPGR